MNRGSWNQRSKLLATLAAVGLLMGCVLPGQDPGSVGIVVRNLTPMPLTFEMLLPDRTLSIPGSLDAGVTGPIIVFVGAIPQGRLDVDKDGCTKGVLIARDPSGGEMARHPAGLCVGDPWVVQPPPPTTSP
jgi:hypothetical protein